jgi:hypothetical protein
MATQPVYVAAPPNQLGLHLNTTTRPVVGSLDPVAGPNVHLIEMTNNPGTYQALIVDATPGDYIGYVSVGLAGPVLVSEIALQFTDTEEPVFEANLWPSVEIKRNTPFPNFKFLMVLASDGITPATGLTITSTRSIDAATTFEPTDNTAVEMSDGWYKIDMTAADLNGKAIAFKFSAPTALDRDISLGTQL